MLVIIMGLLTNSLCCKCPRLTDVSFIRPASLYAAAADTISKLEIFRQTNVTLDNEQTYTYGITIPPWCKKRRKGG